MTVVEAAHDRAEGRLSALMGVINSAAAEYGGGARGCARPGRVGGGRDPFARAVGGVAVRGVAPPVRDLVCMARRRAELPAMTKLFDAGLVSEDAAAAIARRVPAARDAEVAELAPVLLHTQLTRWLAAVPAPRNPTSIPTPTPPAGWWCSVSPGMSGGAAWTCPSTRA